jgi:periplasmic protein CpxP/Spy
MFSRSNLTLFFALILSLGAVSEAQEPQKPSAAPDDSARPRLGRMRMHGRGTQLGRGRLGLFGLQGELALTETQLQQLRAIHQRQFEGAKAQREELFQLGEKRTAGTFTAADAERAKALHQELRESQKGVENEVENILTPEQRTKIEELRKERKARHEERMRRREGFRETRPQL